MGAQASFKVGPYFYWRRVGLVYFCLNMVLPMKAKKAGGQKAMTKGALVKALAEHSGLKTKQISTIIAGIAEIGVKEVKRVSKFTIPQVCMIKSRQKPATKAGKRIMFGKEVVVKAKPAKTVVKAYPVSAIKKQF